MISLNLTFRLCIISPVRRFCHVNYQLISLCCAYISIFDCYICAVISMCIDQCAWHDWQLNNSINIHSICSKQMCTHTVFVTSLNFIFMCILTRHDIVINVRIGYSIVSRASNCHWLNICLLKYFPVTSLSANIYLNIDRFSTQVKPAPICMCV